MGNTLGGKKTAKIMMINGDTMKFKTPVHAGDVLKDYPGLVLLESEAVKHFGIRAKPLEPWQELKPKRLYFLVELPRVPEERVPRRVRSGINMSAKDRLESLMLARRSASDLSIMKPRSIVIGEERQGSETAQSGELRRVKMRLPKAEVARLMMESRDGADVAEKIVDLCLANKAAGGGGGGDGGVGGGVPPKGSEGALVHHHHQQLHWKDGDGKVVKDGFKGREKRVGFLPISEGEIQLALAS
ncbi:unnamed protein product [Camellia sinensis]